MYTLAHENDNYMAKRTAYAAYTISLFYFYTESQRLSSEDITFWLCMLFYMCDMLW